MATDSELYAAWAGGDRRAGERLVDRHLNSVHRFFAAKLSDPAAADDLVARTFEVVAGRLGTWRAQGSVRAYIFGIAHNHLRNHLRALGRERQRFEPLEHSVAELDPSPASLIVHEEQRRLLVRALRQIPLQLQIAVELSFFEGMSRAELAEVLGIPAGTVAGRLRRAQQLLEARIRELAARPELRESTLGSVSDWVRRVRALQQEQSG